MEILRKYGAGATLYFPLIDAGAQDFEATPVTFAAGDTKVSKDGGTFANTTNNPAHEGGGIYSLVLTSTEMEAANIAITVIDQGTKAWEDQAIVIATYGHASAEHALDLDTALASQTIGTCTTLTNKTGFSLASTGLDAIVSTATGMVEIARATWDRVLSKANHNIGQSAGKRVRQLGDLVSTDGSVNDASATTTSFISTLTSVVDDFYVDQSIIMVNGSALAGQARIVTAYNGTTKEITVDEAFTSAPGDGDDFILFSPHVHPVSQIATSVWADSTRTLTAGTKDSEIDTINTAAAAIQAKTDGLPGGIAKNTALTNFEFFMVDSTDNKTGKTGLSVTAQRSIDGAAFGACANSASEVSSGVYKIDLDASDLNGDVVTLRFTAGGANERVLTLITQS